MKSQSEPSLTIAIAERQAIVRAGLRALLAAEPGFVVVGETGDPNELPDLVGRLRPDLLLLEPGLVPSAPGQPLAVLRAHPGLKVVVLATPQDEPAAILLLEAGAAGCYLKTDRPEELLRGMRAAAAGEMAVSSAVARRLLQRVARHDRPLPIDTLSPREREILKLLTDGLANKEIAQGLYLSVRTVEVHLRNIYGKLGVRSRLEAVARTRGGLQGRDSSSLRSSE